MTAVFVTLGFYAADFPTQAGWRLLGVSTTLSRAQKFAHSAMGEHGPAGPGGLIEYRITVTYLDEAFTYYDRHVDKGGS